MEHLDLIKYAVDFFTGIAHLFSVYERSPNYTNEEGHMDVADQLAAVGFTRYDNYNSIYTCSYTWRTAVQIWTVRAFRLSAEVCHHGAQTGLSVKIHEMF